MSSSLLLAQQPQRPLLLLLLPSGPLLITLRQPLIPHYQFLFRRLTFIHPIAFDLFHLLVQLLPIEKTANPNPTISRFH